MSLLSGKNTYKVIGTKVRETDAAILWNTEIKLDDGDTVFQDMWFPFSQVESIHPDHLIVSNWIAEKKGLI